MSGQGSGRKCELPTDRDGVRDATQDDPQSGAEVQIVCVRYGALERGDVAAESGSRIAASGERLGARGPVSGEPVTTGCQWGASSLCRCGG